LLVEDDDDTREALTMLLGSLGVGVTSAHNGRDALAVLRDGFTPCLLLLDVRMPDMGAEAFRTEQRSDPKIARIPIVLMSGDSELSDLAAKLGAAGYVSKPLEPDKLLDVVREYCGEPHPRGA
jgi:CheY-like chemotaxis protein